MIRFNAPDEDTLFSSRIPVEKQKEQEATATLEVVGGAWFRHSDAGSCWRQIAYKMQLVRQLDRMSWAEGEKPTSADWIRRNESNPADIHSQQSFAVGHAIHELWQGLADSDRAATEVEVTIGDPDRWDGRPLTGGHIDEAYTHDGGRVSAVELKTVNEYGYKAAVLDNHGPKWAHVLQACLNGYALSADEAVVVYVPLTLVSAGRADRKGIDHANRHGSQWTIGGADMVRIAEAELARVEQIWQMVKDEGAVSVPTWWADGPVGGSSGKDWIRIGNQSDRVWPCGYCPFRDVCVMDEESV